MKKLALMFGVCCMVAMLGCSGGTDDKTLSQKAGEDLGKSAVDFAQGIGKGIDEKLAVKVEFSKALTDLGASFSAAKPNFKDGKAISVYLLTKNPFKGTLITKALDAKGNEVGRATAEVDSGKDDAKFIDFKFDSRMDYQMVDKFFVEIKE